MTDTPDQHPPRTLSADHLAELAASAIPPALAEAAGWHTETDPAVVAKNLNWSRAAVKHLAKRGPFLAIPYLGLDGRPNGHVRYKPAHPREEKRDDGKVRVVKYEAPKGVGNRLFLPPCLAKKLADPNAAILLTEGEKKVLAAMAADDALACIGLSGVWAWTKDDEIIPDLSLIDWDGRVVYLAFDADAATNEHVATALKALARVLVRLGAEVRVVVLPPGPPDADGKPGKMGLDDFLAAGGKMAELLAAAKEPADLDQRPKVYATPDLHRTVDAVRRHLACVPDLYSHGNLLVRADRDGKLYPVRADAMPVEVSRHVRMMSRKERADGSIEDRQISPPADVCKGVHADPGPPIREVVSVASYPQMLADGRILSDAGYDPASRLLITATTGLLVTPVDRPARDDAKRACDALLDVFREFPFPPDAAAAGRSKSAILAIILTLIARPMIPGPTPFFLVQKNAPAAGGTLVLKAVWRIVTGGDLPTVSYTHDEPESRKVLTSLVLDGRAAAVWDNVDGEFGTASLCRFITSPVWEDRVLSVSKMMIALNLMVMAGSANNAVLVREMPRRVVTIDLYTDAERPEQAKKDRPDLLGYIDEHRGELLAAAFTVLRFWVQAGRPQPARAKPDDPDPMPHYGSFEAWSAVIRAALIHAGQPDPYTPAASRDDHRLRLLRTVAVGLKEMDPAGHGLTAAQIVKRLNTSEYQASEIGDMGDALAELAEKLTAVSLGKTLAQAKGRNLGGIRFVEVARDQRANMARWTAEDVVTSAKKTDREQQEAKTPPESPANGGTTESMFAGDSGDKSRGPRSRPNSATATGDPETDPTAFETLLRQHRWDWVAVGTWLDAQAEYVPDPATFSNTTLRQKRMVIAHLEGKAVAR